MSKKCIVPSHAYFCIKIIVEGQELGLGLAESVFCGAIEQAFGVAGVEGGHWDIIQVQPSQSLVIVRVSSSGHGEFWQGLTLLCKHQGVACRCDVLALAPSLPSLLTQIQSKILDFNNLVQ